MILALLRSRRDVFLCRYTVFFADILLSSFEYSSKEHKSIRDDLTLTPSFIFHISIDRKVSFLDLFFSSIVYFKPFRVIRQR